MAQPIISNARELVITGVPDGLDARVIADLVRHTPGASGKDGESHASLLHIARDDRRLEALEQGLKFFAPDTVVSFPAWDCVPYDRVSPNSEIVARRISRGWRGWPRASARGRWWCSPPSMACCSGCRPAPSCATA